MIINNYKNNESFDYIFREKAIILCIMIDDILMIFFSFISYFVKIKFFVYSSIVVSGAFNFFLYDYFSFSTAQGEYLTFSGIISFSQALFRLLELFDSYFYLDESFWYIIQLCLSFVGASLCIIYLYKLDFFSFINSRYCKNSYSKDSQNIPNNFIISNSEVINE